MLEKGKMFSPITRGPDLTGLGPGCAVVCLLTQSGQLMCTQREERMLWGREAAAGPEERRDIVGSVTEEGLLIEVWRNQRHKK